ncbi:hypothetical protein GY45DRAFT_1303752 [Cubamyces sp. BRFM 1775]|nr:hypothetical protein GY45DRAFT_1303752 [Cubamyces sp. BRFM 1775]
MLHIGRQYNMTIAGKTSHPIITEVPPYTDPSAGDIIIRTSDGVDFHVSRRRLAVLGARLDALLPSTAASSPTVKPSINISESSAVWEKFLRVCLVDEEMSYTLDDVAALVETGLKYGVPAIVTRMRYALMEPTALEMEPVRAFLMASAYGLDDVAQVAARRTLQAIDHAAFGARKDVSVLDYVRLMQYQNQCSDAARALVLVPQRQSGNSLPGWVAEHPHHWSLLSVTCTDRCAADARTVSVTEVEGQPTMIYVSIRKSWITYLETLGKTLRCRPWGPSASEPDLLEPVITSALDCHACAKVFFRNAVAFAKIMEAKIEQAVAEVTLPA